MHGMWYFFSIIARVLHHHHLLHTYIYMCTTKTNWKWKKANRNIPQNRTHRRFFPHFSSSSLLHRLNSLLCIHFHLVKIKRAILSFRIVTMRIQSKYSYINTIWLRVSIRCDCGWLESFGPQFVMPQTKICAEFVYGTMVIILYPLRGITMRTNNLIKIYQ